MNVRQSFLLAAVFLVGLIVGYTTRWLKPGLSLEDWSRLATVFAAFVAAGGVIVAAVGVFLVRSQITISNAIRRSKLIATIYDAFLTDDLYNFYAKIRKGKKIDWEHNEVDERLLNKSLTLFDEVNYLQTQGLLAEGEEAWEYAASEIQYFAFNKSVWDYMFKRIHEGMCRGLPRDIIPFTGFPELLKSIPPKFRADPFPRIPKRHRAFFGQINS